MDTEQLKTFLEVNRTRHFGRAAQNLFLSQSAVSSRIQALEEQVGNKLFFRHRHDIQLTPAGNRLLQHAENILAAWQRAKHDVALDEGKQHSLAIAATPSLWDIQLQEWLHTLHDHQPETAIHAEVLDGDTIVYRLLEGTLDLGFSFTPPQTGTIHTQPVANVALTMVCDRDNLTVAQACEKDYVLVDWGLSFAIQHAQLFPNMPTPAIQLPLGRMALDYLLNCGGCAYLAAPMIRSALEAGDLYLVTDAPVIERPAYALHHAQTDNQQLIQAALSLLVAPANNQTDKLTGKLPSEASN